MKKKRRRKTEQQIMREWTGTHDGEALCIFYLNCVAVCWLKDVLVNVKFELNSG